MSESEGREIDPITGYPKMEESSASEGAPQEGASPGSGDATPQSQDTQHEPPPGSQRWNEVYRQMKENERRANELERQLQEARLGRSEDIFNPQQPTDRQAQAPQPQMQGEDDPFAPLYEGIVQRLAPMIDERIKPIQQSFAQQQMAARIEQQRAQVRQRYGDYDPQRDDSVLMETARRYGVNDFEVAYRLSFPERVVAAAQKDMQAQASRAPVADVRGTSPTAPAQSAEDLMREFNATRDPRRREEIATILADGGAWGASRAEKALGLG